MITFGNESLQNSLNNSNNIQTSKKSDEFELLKKKYKKLEKENKMLKATLEELINLSEILKSSFKNTENMYVTISDSIKGALSGKFYNTGLANSTDTLLKSQILGSQENLLNLNQGSSLNFFATGQLAELNKNGINNNVNNSSVNLNNSPNLPININLNSNTNITNIYNNADGSNATSTNINNNNKSLSLDDISSKGKASNSEAEDEKENRGRSSRDEFKENSDNPRKNSLKKNSSDKNIVLTLGDEHPNSKSNFEKNTKEKEKTNAISLIDDCKNSKMISENESKNYNNLNAINNIKTTYDLSNAEIKENNLEKEFSEKSENSSLINDKNTEKKDIPKVQNEENIDKNLNNNNTNANTNDNSTNKDSNKNTNGSQNQKLENKDNKNFSSEINLEVEFENITKLILDNQNKKEENNDEFLNKLADNFTELQKKFFQIKFEKEEYEKINTDILKNLKQTEENYNVISAKYDELNKYIDILYKSIHSILVLSDSSDEKTQTIKCEPVPSYLRFINNVIN